MKHWDLLKEFYHKGLNLDEAGRRDWAEVNLEPETVRDLASLWRHAAPEELGFNFDSISNQVTKVILEQQIPTPPERVGPYRILKALEGGGMGAVYLAEQEEPMTRRVVVKMLQPGQQGGKPMQRFLLEQRALALLRHPNVATILDRGVTHQGLPWFAIEYLEGPPLTHYCESRRLKLSSRLALFLQVCEGVAYAHRKGIIHRDLKPSNILVTEEGGTPVPKIIDFGIAHLTTDQASSLKTQDGFILGTPAYMSPERATGRREGAADVRGDIYALGAILFELLTGETPLARVLKRVEDTESMLREIRIAVRPVPSSRFRITDGACHGSTADRSAESHSLYRQIRGDLDWITSKALVTQPEQRYPTAEALREDIARHLDGRPVLAAPPSAAYQIRAFVRRHGRLVSVAAAFLLLFLVGVVGISVSLVRATHAEREAREMLARFQKVNRFTLDLFREVNPRRQGHQITGVELLERAAVDVGKTYEDQPELEALTREVLGSVFRDLGYLPEAADQLENAISLRVANQIEDHEETLLARTTLAHIYHLQERDDRAAALYESCCPEMQRRYGAEDVRTLQCRSGLADVLASSSDPERADAMFQEVLEVQRRVRGSNNYDTLSTANNYANLLIRQGRFEEAELLLRHKHLTYAAQFGDDHLSTLDAAHNLARLNQARGQFALACQGFLSVWKERRRVLGVHHPETLGSLGNLLLAMAQDGRAKEAATLFRKEETSLSELERRPSAVTLRMLHNLGHTLMTAGEVEEAERILGVVHAGRRDLYGPYDQRTLYTWVTLAQNHQRAGHVRKAANMFEVANQEAEVHLDAVDTALFRGLWAVALAELGHANRAMDLLQNCLPTLEAVRHPEVSHLATALHELEKNQR